MAWFNNSWNYRVKITVDAAKVDADLSDFPVYVKLADLPAGFHNNVKSDGSDIRVTKSDGTTEVPREVVYYDATNDVGELHFKAAGTLSGTENTAYYIYYGNSSASDYGVTDTYGRNNVWDANYKGVYHFGNGSSLAVTDSTGNNNATNNSATATAGQVGGGVNFNGSSHYMTTAMTIGALGSSFTLSMWASSTNTATTTTPIAFNSDANDTGWALILVNASNWRWQKDEGAFPFIQSTVSRVNDDWIHYTVTTTGSSAGNTKLFTDGVQQDDAVAVPTPTSTYTTKIGRQLPGSPSRYFSGKLDEVRFSNTARASTWISTEFNNQNAPATFYAITAQETVPIRLAASSRTAASRVAASSRTASSSRGAAGT